ncbi:MAG: TIGR02270 family protein [Nannocystaceae bacterium]|nr:TIGR02270 family protein [bacterium]
MGDILWDVVEEHLDEAEFLAEVWHVNLDSPAYLRDEFESGPQERLMAHVDGLVVGGDEVRTELLEAALADEDTERWRAAAAALALLETPSSQVSAGLFTGLDERPDEVREGIVAALSMSPRADIDVRITDALAKDGDLAHRAALATVGGNRGVNPGNRVDDLLQGEDPTAKAAAISMLAFGDRRYLNWVEHCLADPDPQLRRAALRSGLIMGSGPAWQSVGKLGLAAEPDPDAMVLLATLADARIVERMCGRLSDDEEEHRAALVHALGYSGRRCAMEACLPLLAHESLGPLAGEAFASMTGLPLDDDAYWDDVEDDDDTDVEDEDLDAELDADDDDDDLEVRPEDELRIPKPGAIAQWWSEAQARFNPKMRYIAGRPADQAAIGHAFAVLPLRRHHAFAFELLVRSKGQTHLRSRALTDASAAALDALHSMPRIDGNRPYGQH